MKYDDLKLPIFKDFILGWSAIFVTSLSLFTIIFSLTTNHLWIQLTSLLQSKYTYSVMVNEPTGLDNYYIFSANISFSLPGEGHNINADVVMQIRNSQYSDNVAWNSFQELSSRGIAVSENIADRMSINIGDVLHSTHRVRGVVMEYVVEEIVPPVGWIVQNDFRRTDGVIIMGFDDDYVDNINYEIIFFTSEPLSDILHYSPTDIIYRRDNIRNVITRIIPAIIVLLVICTGALMLFSHMFVQKHRASYKRLQLLGYDRNGLMKVWKRQYILIGLPPIIVSIIISFVWAFLSTQMLFISAISACVQILMFFIMLRLSLKHGRSG